MMAAIYLATRKSMQPQLVQNSLFSLIPKRITCSCLYNAVDIGEMKQRYSTTADTAQMV